jgi:soluble lytic murein transglycosylase
MIFRIILLCLAISIFPDYGHTAIYGYIADDGVYHYTNMIPIGKKFRVIITDRIKSIVTKNIDNTSYDSLISQHAATHGVDPMLIKAVMKAESNFNPKAVSHKGAQGLMQLMPDTARLMNVDDPFDPEDNIKGGTRYLKYLDEIFGGDLELVLAAYNAGPKRVMDNNMNVPPYEETKSYIQRVKSYYNKLKKPHES